MPFMQVFVRAVCTATLGACEGALEAFIEVAKTRQVGPNKMKNDPFARQLAAEVKASIEEMKLTMIRNFDAMMACCRAGEPIPIEDRDARAAANVGDVDPRRQAIFEPGNELEGSVDQRAVEDLAAGCPRDEAFGLDARGAW